MDLDQTYPAISDLKARARRRVPHFVWEFFDSATGTESVLPRNRAALDRVLFHPAILTGEFTPDLSCTLMGRDYAVPFGIAPVGMSGVIWPDAERRLARFAGSVGVPYGLSTVASQTPETVGPEAGGMGWFQLYPPRAPEVLADMLARAWDAGFHTLVLTADVPVASRRERQTRGGLTNPPRLTPRLMAQVMRCPAWALGTLRTGMPRMRTLDRYAEQKTSLPQTAHVGYLIRTSPDWDYLGRLRDLWQGKLVVKGVMEAAPVERLQAAGVDAIWVSNHAGRQFDGARASIDALPEIRAATRLPLIFDSGIEGGLDIMRALALGADFVMLGRAWHYALAALGEAGPPHLHALLVKDMISCMGQIGARRLSELPGRLVVPRTG
ncbi:alpha-hydroxy acid oxidase [Nioella sediminis]|jgi:L-lactate dehydrogenase (cytochrome)|uniref:alpha-hydroxy acid oxidase n=1 Tax=Nioella sediminis TaxID=1912092 RepID=UPI0009F808C1|nr:alpha-hydroxy acid oxidase [Nioella sediminis]TBX27688.1 alpha-hydroxy acid dehydrogenase [Roseovarius sp. JS7-11]